MHTHTYTHIIIAKQAHLIPLCFEYNVNFFFNLFVFFLYVFAVIAAVEKENCHRKRS